MFTNVTICTDTYSIDVIAVYGRLIDKYLTTPSVFLVILYCIVLL